jgi:hypothetical protein
VVNSVRTVVKYIMQPSRRLPCGNLLLKTVEYISGKKFLYPFKIYGYKSLNQSLQSLLLRPSFYANCQEWRSRPNTSIQDIYDGKIWKDYQQYLGLPFLSQPFSFAFVLNVDWFQPYTIQWV